MKTLLPNGQDFDRQQARTSNGIESLHRRAEAIGAGYTLTAEPGQGTTVTVEKKRLNTVVLPT